jgi:lipopolysaccharide biosynthesis glycosyltransferase
MTPTTGHLVLALGADDNYALPLSVTVASVLDRLTNRAEVDLFVLDGGIHRDRRARIRRVVRRTGPLVHLHWIDPPGDGNAHLPTRPHTSTAAYRRLSIPEAVPDTFSRCIYLDCDMMAHRSLQRLMDIPFDGNALLACPNVGWEHTFRTDDCIEVARHAGLNPESRLFNSGLVVLNLEAWRRDNISRAVRSCLQNNRARGYTDQRALNVVLCDDWKALDLRWNVQSSLVHLDAWPASRHKDVMRRRRDAIVSDPFITHFSGSSKPWQVGCSHPRQLDWVRHLWNSGWYRYGERPRVFARWFSRYLWRRLRDTSRPLRHALARRFPDPLARVLRR